MCAFKTRLVAPRASRKEVLVIGGAVRLEDLGQLVASLLDQLVVVLWHVQLEERGTRAGEWHPRALPRLLKVSQYSA